MIIIAGNIFFSCFSTTCYCRSDEVYKLRHYILINALCYDFYDTTCHAYPTRELKIWKLVVAGPTTKQRNFCNTLLKFLLAYQIYRLSTKKSAWNNWLFILSGGRYVYDMDAKRYNVLRVLMHEDYKKEQIFACDIALVFPEKPIQFGTRAQRAILVNHNKWMDEREKNFTPIGWGYTQVIFIVLYFLWL